jgi:hypothetical protein
MINFIFITALINKFLNCSLSSINGNDAYLLLQSKILIYKNSRYLWANLTD